MDVANEGLTVKGVMTSYRIDASIFCRSYVDWAKQQIGGDHVITLGRA
ncbi:MAG: hypothetical protein K2P84_13555 [Undibacterium sp.]|nr:hypothetical protein [Undibacterium sp.]